MIASMHRSALRGVAAPHQIAPSTSARVHRVLRRNLSSECRDTAFQYGRGQQLYLRAQLDMYTTCFVSTGATLSSRAAAALGPACVSAHAATARCSVLHVISGRSGVWGMLMCRRLPQARRLGAGHNSACPAAGVLLL
jgi:hypothetical protein